LLWYGCNAARTVGGAGGLNGTRPILNALWKQNFSNKKITDFAGRPLKYYGSWDFRNHIHSIPGLLLTQDGQCDTWAQYLAGALLVQGIDIANPTCIRPNANDAELIMVKKWSKPAMLPAGKKGYPWANFSKPVGSYPNYGFAAGAWQYFWFSPPAAPAPTWTYPPGVLGTDGGQNQPNPFATFDNHWIVRIGDASGANNQYYDPSYGGTYADPGDMEQKALDAFYYRDGTRFNIRAAVGPNNGIAPPRADGKPFFPGGNMLERCVSLRLQFFLGPNPFKPDSDGQPANTALNGGATAAIKTGAGGDVTVWVVDGYGSKVVKKNLKVYLIVGNDPTGGAAQLTMTGIPVGKPVFATTDATTGLATFPGLALNQKGDAFTLRAVVSGGASSPQSCVSQMFEVGP